MSIISNTAQTILDNLDNIVETTTWLYVKSFVIIAFLLLLLCSEQAINIYVSTVRNTEKRIRKWLTKKSPE